MSSQPNVTLPGPVLDAVKEKAALQQKSPDEMAGELVLIGLAALRDSEGRKTALLNLIDYGRQRTKESGLENADAAEIVHQWRDENRSRR